MTIEPKQLLSPFVLDGMTLKEYRVFSPLFDEAVFSITAESSAGARDNPGGTSPQRVRQALKSANKLLGTGPKKPF